MRGLRRGRGVPIVTGSYRAGLNSDVLAHNPETADNAVRHAPACRADWRLAARRIGILRASVTSHHQPAGSE
jgi:hypothetical protein